MWREQVDYAQVLREKRKLYTAALVVFGSVGLFRLALRQPENLVPVVPSWADWVIRVLGVCSLVSMIASALYLYTERPVVRAVLSHVSKRLLEKADQQAQDWGLPPFKEAFRAAGRASDVLQLDDDTVEMLLNAPEHEVWLMRRDRLVFAYERLRWANTRVNARIRIGVVFLGVAFLLILASVCIFLLASAEYS